MASPYKETITTTEDMESGNASNAGDGGEVAIHNDTFAINREALGKDLPPNYWRSPGFIGTVTALCFGSISNYATWVMPSNSLALINASIGPSEFYLADVVAVDG